MSKGEETYQVVEVVSESDLYIDPEAEAKVVRKLDFNVLTIVGLLYFLAALDRSNIGNSASAGLKDELGLTDAQLSNCVSLFFITYILSEWPATLLLKKLTPHKFLAGCGLCWGIVTLCMTFVSNYGSLLALRLLLGLFEGGYFPCLAIIVSMFYKPQEQGLRMAIILSCAALAGAFGGLISYALVQVKTDKFYLQGYRLIYTVEGLITIISIPIIYFLLPDSPENCKFLNEQETRIMIIRKRQRQEYMGKEKFEWKEAKKAFADPRAIFSPVIQFCGDTILYGFSNFLPVILRSGLGYNVEQAQYLTIPVYFLSSVSVLSLSWLSDRLQLRSPFIIGSSIVGLIGYVILISVANNSVKYFATYLVAITLYTIPGINIAWTASNSQPHYRRTTLIGTNQTFGNVSGAIAGQVYRKSPFRLGHAFSLGCLCVSVVATFCNTLWLKRENYRKLEILNGEKPDNKRERTGDHALDFKYGY